MRDLLALIPAFPLAGAILLMLGSFRLTPVQVRLIGIGSVGISALLAGILALGLPSGGALDVTLWQWMRVGAFASRITLHLDGLSLVMMLVITVIGFLIHLYAADYMKGDDGYARFFACMNLFVSAMLLLVLADDLLVLYVGWEGVGLCSYLLIGFWYEDPANGRCARKAFIVTRIGDTALIVGLFLLATHFHTLAIQPLMQDVSGSWTQGSLLPTLAAFLILGGAVGKSAQLPLQTWLPDAMAGPTPVSALIHAATMVTAGVYLIARTHVLFSWAPAAQMATGVIGALTLLISACSALTQTDIKRVLAYSTISQIGYMFLALGVGAWDGAIFHLVTHAFFKALLFMSAGAVILRVHHEQDMFRMGGLRRAMPGVFASFVIGSASLAALPLVTAGFYSKETILQASWADGYAGRMLWCAGIVGAFLTALYIFRAVFIVFFGEERTHAHGATGWRIAVPLSVLSVLALVGGFMQMPAALAHVTLLSDLLRGVFGAGPSEQAASKLPMLVASLAPIAGIALAWWLYGRPVTRPSHALDSPGARFFRSGWELDRLYERCVTAPVFWLVHFNRADFIDGIFDAVAQFARSLHAALSLTQTGRVRWYAGCLAVGSLAAVTIAVLS